MQNEYEVVSHLQIQYFNLLAVRLRYRTPHLHDEMEIGMIMEGAGKLQRGAEAVSLGPGEVYVVNSLESHEFSSPQGALILSLQVSPKLLAPYFPTAVSSVFLVPQAAGSFPKDQYELLCSLMVEIGYHFFCRFPGYEFTCMSMLNMVFYLLYAYLPRRSLSEEERGALFARMNRMSRITRFVDENFHQKLLLRDIARREGLTMSYLSHLFRDTMNMTFQEYLNEVRLEYACQLLRSTDRGISDICLESGFSDIRYLNQAFSKRYQCSPKEYREKNRQSGDKKTGAPGSLEQVLDREESIRYLASLREGQRKTFSRYSLWDFYHFFR